MEIAGLLVTADGNMAPLEQKLDRLGLKYDQTVKRFRDGNGAFVSAANVQKLLEGQLDKTARSAAVLGDNFGRLDTRVKQSLTGMLSMAGISLSVVGALGLILSEGTRTEDSLNTLKAVTRATGEEMARVSALARDLGNDINLPGTSAADAADAMVELAKGGLTLQQAMDAARGTIQLARAATIGEAQAATIAADALNTFGLAGTQATRVADLLAGASIAASGEVTDMAQALAQAGAVARGAKVSLEETVTTISLLAKNGIKGSDAGTSLKTFLLALQTPVSNEAVEALNRLKIEVYDANKAFKPLPQLIADFSQRLEGLNDQDKADVLRKIFGADAIRAARIIFGEGAAGFAAMEAAVTRSGQAAEIAAAKSQGLSGAWDALKSTVQTLAIDIFQLIGGPLTGLLNLIGKYPGLFAAAAIAIGGLVAAHALYNSELLITAATRIPMMLASIRNLITVMFSFSQVTALSGTALASFALGWAGIVAAIGIGVVALVDWSSATDRANAITVESISNLAAQANQFSQMQQEASELASKQSLNTEEHKKLEAILSTLNPTTRAYIGTLGTEKEKIDEVKKAIDDLANRSETELKASLVTLSQAISKTNDQISEKERRIRIVNRIMDEWKEKSRVGTITQQELKNVVDSFSAEIAAAGEKINKELNPQLLSLSEKFSLNTNALHYTREQLIAFLKESGNSADQIKIVITQYDAWAAKNNQVTGALNQTTAATNAQAEALANLQNIMNRFNARDQNITARVMSIVDQAKNKGEAVRMAREAMQGDAGFRADVQGSLADKSEKEAVERALGLSGGGGGGGGRRRGGGGGGGGGGESPALKNAKLELEWIEIVERAAGRSYNRRTKDEQYYYDVGRKTIESYFGMLETLEDEHFQSQKRIAEQQLVVAQNTGKKGSQERINAVADAQDKITALYQTHEQNLSQIERDAYAARRERTRQLWSNETGVLEEYASNVEAIYSRLAERGVITFVAAQAAISAQQFELLLREKKRLENELKDVDPLSLDGIKIDGKLKELLQKIEGFNALKVLLDDESKRRELEREWSHADKLLSISQTIEDMERDSQQERIRLLEAAGVNRATIWRKQLDFELEAERVASERRIAILRQENERLETGEGNPQRRAELIAANNKMIEAEERRSADRRSAIWEDYYNKQREKMKELADKIVGIFKTGLDGGMKAALQSLKNILEEMALEWLKSKIYKILLEIKGIPAPGQGNQQQAQSTQGSNPFDALSGIFSGVIKNIFSHGNNAQGNSAGEVRSAGQEMAGAITNAGGKSATEVERAGNETQRSLSGISRELVTGLSGIATIIAASNTRGSFWSGLFMAAASGAVSGALGAIGSPSSSGGGGHSSSGHSNAPAPHYAVGGWLKGPGTSTSDSILGLDRLTGQATAWVSRDEYVIRAASAARLGPQTLDYINEFGRLPRSAPYQPPVRRAGGGSIGRSNSADDYAFGGEGGSPPPVVVNIRPDAQGRVRSKDQVTVEAWSTGNRARRNS